MQAGGDAGEDGTALGAGLVANGDHIGEAFARFDHVESGFGLVAGDVYADFLHGFNHDGIKFARFEAGAVGFEFTAADLVEKGFGHLAAGAVMDTDEQDFLFHDG